MASFKWRLCSYVGGDYAIHPHYKSYLILMPENNQWTGGTITIQPRDTSTISVACGFQPNLLIMVSYRPKYANGSWDSSFGLRGGGMTFGVAGDDAQFTGSTRFQQGYDIHMGLKRWREDVCFNVAHGGTGYPGYANAAGWPGYPDFDTLTLEHTFTATGFDLAQMLNLYDGPDEIYWIAMQGNFKVGVFDSGDTTVSGVPFKPEGAAFFSVKTTADETQPPTIGNGRPNPDPWHVGYWDMMRGYASVDGQVCTWGGCRPTSWNWTTDYFSDRSAIVLPTAANGSGLLGASISQEARVTDWWEDTDVITITRSGSTATVAHTGHGFATGQQVQIAGADQAAYNGIQTLTVTDADHYTYAVTGSPATPATGTITATVGGIDLQWDAFDNIPYRIGYVMGESGEAGWFESNFNKRPGGSEADADGNNTQPTRLNPRVILMTSTGYNFNFSETDPLALPRAINDFSMGGSGGFGFHWFLATDVSARGVATHANAVAERGHYANSTTIRETDCIAHGGGTGNQHGVSILSGPKWVGMNWRSAERHISATRALVNKDDV